MLDLNNFMLEPEEIGLIYKFIRNKSRPIPIRELGELVIRHRLEALAAAEGQKDTYSPDLEIRRRLAGIARSKKKRIYSPELKYFNAEKIYFYYHSNKKLILAEIKKIEKRFHSLYGPYEAITVSLHGDETEFVTNCPRFPLRFSDSTKKQHPTHAKNQITTPGQLYSKYESKLKPSINKPLSCEDELANVDDEWCIKDRLPRIRDEEIQQCYEFITKNGRAMLSRDLVCDVLKCFPSSLKFDLFKFSLDYCLRKDRNFIKHQSSDGIKWDIKRAIPPRQIKNTLTLPAITYGFIKITKGLKELLKYCKAGDEITFKSYGEYEIKAEIDHSLKRISSEQIRQWFFENDLKPKDVIYIKSPTSENDLPILYTAFEHDSHERTAGKKKQESISITNFRHRIHNLFYSRGQYIHVHEIHREIEESSSGNVTISTIEGVLSKNNHLFTRLHQCRGLWGLLEWESNRPSIDSVSLSLAIKEEDWVIRLLKDEGEPLAVAELAERLSSTFITQKDVILEINFFDPSDERLIQLNGKWALKTWAEDWKQRIKEIDQELLEYQNLLNILSELKGTKTQLESKLLNLKNIKTKIKDQLPKIKKQIINASNKRPFFEKQLEKLNKELNHLHQQINSPNKIISPFFTFLLLPLIGAGLITSRLYIHYIPGYIFFIVTLLWIYLLAKEIKKNIHKKKLIKRHTELKINIASIDEYLCTQKQNCRLAESKHKDFLNKLELIDKNIYKILSEANILKDRIKNISYRIKVFKEQELTAEKRELTDLIDRCAL